MADYDVKIIVNINIKETDKKIIDNGIGGLEACGLLAERLAKQLCQVDTGRLRNSITHAASGQPAKQHSYAPSNVSKYEGGITKEGKRVSLSKKQREAATVTENIPAIPKEELVMYIGTNVEYGPIIELGANINGKHIPAMPFLTPALQNYKEKYKAVLKHYLNK